MHRVLCTSLSHLFLSWIMESKLPCGQSTSPIKFSIQRLKKTCHVKKKKEREQSILELGSERLLTRMFFSSWAGQLTWWRLRYIYAAGPIKEVGWELGGDNWFFSTLKVTHVWFNWKSMSFFLLVQESLAVCRGDPSSIWNLSTKQLNCGGLG